jgi:hypothetical protein
MSIHAPVLVLEGSDIIANALPGLSGNIDIFADHVVRSSNSNIRASSELRFFGNPNTENPAAGLLSVSFLNAPSLLTTPCAARGGRRASSLTPGGRGGLPPDPGTPLMATPSGQPPKQKTATGLPTTSTARPQQAAKPIAVAGIPQPVLGSPRLTCKG